MKKRLAILLPIAAVVIAVFIYLLAARPWLITKEPNTYEINTEAPVVVVFESFDNTCGDYRIINTGSEAVFCVNTFEIQCKKDGTWYKVKPESPHDSQALSELKQGENESYWTHWRIDGKSLPAGEYRLVTPIKPDSGGSYWVAAPFTVS